MPVKNANHVRISPPPDLRSLYFGYLCRGTLVKETDARKAFKLDSDIFTSNLFRILPCNWGVVMLLFSVTVDIM